MTMDFGTDRVLVTGAAGWLGSNLVQALVQGLPEVARLAGPQAGLRVRALVLPGTAPAEWKAADVEVCEGDLTQSADCERLCAGAAGATLFHVAGIIHPQRVRDFYAVNVRGTDQLLAAAARAGVRRVVAVSSNSPFGCNPDQRLFDESSPYRPYRHYGRSKMKMEQVVRGWQQSGKLETVIVRIPWFYGPHQPARQRLFFEMVRDGKAPIVGGGENLRSMSYTDNSAQGVILAALTPAAAGRAYWVADEHPYTMHQIVDTIEDLLESDFGQACAHRRMRLPGFVSSVASVCDIALQGFGLYHTKIHVLSEMNKTIACGIEAAKRELGYAPAVALREGMRRSLAEFYAPVMAGGKEAKA